MRLTSILFNAFKYARAAETSVSGSFWSPNTIAVVGRTGPDRLLRLAALFHDIGKPRTRAIGPNGVSFHHHEVVGARMTRRRMTELRYSAEAIDQVVRLVELHLRFHGYLDQGWTDAAVRRYVRDAGSPEQLRRLNLLTRADVTTQNRRKERILQAAMDDLERRVERLREQEQLDALRPPLDGNQIMARLGIRPGPLVGKAYRHLLEARIEQGPLTQEQGERLLDAWAAEHSEHVAAAQTSGE